MVLPIRVYVMDDIKNLDEAYLFRVISEYGTCITVEGCHYMIPRKSGSYIRADWKLYNVIDKSTISVECCCSIVTDMSGT